MVHLEMVHLEMVGDGAFGEVVWYISVVLKFIMEFLSP